MSTPPFSSSLDETDKLRRQLDAANTRAQKQYQENLLANRRAERAEERLNQVLWDIQDKDVTSSNLFLMYKSQIRELQEQLAAADEKRKTEVEKANKNIRQIFSTAVQNMIQNATREGYQQGKDEAWAEKEEKLQKQHDEARLKLNKAYNDLKGEAEKSKKEAAASRKVANELRATVGFLKNQLQERAERDRTTSPKKGVHVAVPLGTPSPGNKRRKHNHDGSHVSSSPGDSKPSNHSKASKTVIALAQQPGCGSKEPITDDYATKMQRVIANGGNMDALIASQGQLNKIPSTGLSQERYPQKMDQNGHQSQIRKTQVGSGHRMQGQKSVVPSRPIDPLKRPEGQMLMSHVSPEQSSSAISKALLGQRQGFPVYQQNYNKQNQDRLDLVQTPSPGSNNNGANMRRQSHISQGSSSSPISGSALPYDGYSINAQQMEPSNIAPAGSFQPQTMSPSYSGQNTNIVQNGLNGIPTTHDSPAHRRTSSIDQCNNTHQTPFRQRTSSQVFHSSPLNPHSSGYMRANNLHQSQGSESSSVVNNIDPAITQSMERSHFWSDIAQPPSEPPQLPQLQTYGKQMYHTSQPLPGTSASYDLNRLTPASIENSGSRPQTPQTMSQPRATPRPSQPPSVITCTNCHYHWWNGTCDNGEPCMNCYMTGHRECQRPQCKDFPKGQCKKKACNRVHEDDDRYKSLAEPRKDLKRKHRKTDPHTPPPGNA